MLLYAVAATLSTVLHSFLHLEKLLCSSVFVIPRVLTFGRWLVDISGGTWGFLPRPWERRDVAELFFPYSSSALQEEGLPGFVMGCYFRPFSQRHHLPPLLERHGTVWLSFWVRKNVKLFELKNTPTILGCRLGSFCAACMALFVLFRVGSKLARCLWSKMGVNAVKWCMMKCTCNWLRRAACQDNKWSPFFVPVHLWSCHWEGMLPSPPTLLPLLPLPPAPSSSSSPSPSSPLGCFDVGNQSLLWCRHDGNGGYTIIPHLIQSSHHQITSKDKQETATWKKISSFLLVLHVRLFRVPLKFPGQRSASYSAEIYHDPHPPPPDSEASLHNTDFFFHCCLFLFWALISSVSSARPFPTLSLPSIIHNPQLFLPSHSTTYLRMIIFLFWNVWKRCCPAATTGCGCRGRRFDIFAYQAAYFVLWLW